MLYTPNDALALAGIPNLSWRIWQQWWPALIATPVSSRIVAISCGWTPSTVKDKIINEIRKIYDPELPVNIYELGLIYDIQVKDRKAEIKMTLTTPNCPVAESLPKEVKEGAMQVEEIDDVDLQLFRH